MFLSDKKEEIYSFTKEKLQEYTNMCQLVGVPNQHRATDSVVIHLLEQLRSEYPGIDF